MDGDAVREQETPPLLFSPLVVLRSQLPALYYSDFYSACTFPQSFPPFCLEPSVPSVTRPTLPCLPKASPPPACYTPQAVCTQAVFPVGNAGAYKHQVC